MKRKKPDQPSAAADASEPIIDYYKIQLERERDMRELDIILFKDVWDGYEQLEKKDCQYNRRAFIRTVMAYIEGSSFAFRETLVVSDEFENLDVVEQAFLQNLEPKLTSDGTIETRKPSSYQSTASLLLFTLRAYAKANKVPLDLRLKEAGWCAVQETYERRNKLMHPKDADSLEVTDKHLLQARRAFNWYESRHEGILNAI